MAKMYRNLSTEKVNTTCLHKLIHMHVVHSRVLPHNKEGWICTGGGEQLHTDTHLVNINKVNRQDFVSLCLLVGFLCVRGSPRSTCKYCLNLHSAIVL